MPRRLSVSQSRPLARSLTLNPSNAPSHSQPTEPTTRPGITPTPKLIPNPTKPTHDDPSWEEKHCHVVEFAKIMKPHSSNIFSGPILTVGKGLSRDAAANVPVTWCNPVGDKPMTH